MRPPIAINQVLMSVGKIGFCPPEQPPAVRLSRAHFRLTSSHFHLTQAHFPYVIAFPSHAGAFPSHVSAFPSHIIENSVSREHIFVPCERLVRDGAS